MGCPHHPDKALVLRLICPVCGFVSPYQPSPTYADLIAERNNLRKVVEDICESYPHHKEQVDRGKELLNETH